MKASLDTNVIIHLYRANLQEILFKRFDEGLCIYEQIREIELKNHGQDILEAFDEDVAKGRIYIYSDEELKKCGILSLFRKRVHENEMLYSPQDMGEIYAISLAQTLGIYSLVTDDIKQGGPYMSLLQFEDNDIMPFTYVDVLLLDYLEGVIEAEQVVVYFETISDVSSLGWSLKNHLMRFIKRFWTESYQEKEKRWMLELCRKQGIHAKEKLKVLRDLIKNEYRNV